MAATADETLDSRYLLRILRAVERGYFTVRLPDDLAGVEGDIARTIVEAYGGSLEVEGQGGGTRVSILLPTRLPKKRVTGLR